jgi:hypothetical protein
MKFRKLFFGALCAMMVTAGFTSCSDDDNEDWRDGSQMEMADTRAFILNEGNKDANNSNIIYFDWQEDLVYPKCIYTEQNGKQLGDTGNDICMAGDKILVAVNVSNYVALLTGAGVEKSRFSFEGEEYKHLGQVRSLAVSGNNVFVSSYGGYVSKLRISGNKLNYVDSLKVGTYPETLAEKDGKIYCAVSGWGTDKRVAVIDANKFDAVEYIEVMGNPDNVLASDNAILVQGYGSDNSYPWGTINPDTKEYTQKGNATAYTVYNNVVYAAMSETDWSNWPDVSTVTTLYTYDLTTDKKNNTFFKEMPEAIKSSSAYSLSVNPYTGDIFLATTDFSTDGIIYKFKADGTYQLAFPAYGVNPNKIVFLK